ncbi:alpha/beta-hydrolase [Aulographum hederae CBS 113979]|uniref:Alpha/beta-hydrolase n=1 Tax=Aulographum hederae CBS 113979 TaxID=1176131 RepID=A0A6G1GZ54_9PEZI|nr:alpha/beta-hydrolase [Aulographum hederae CBS 113979]
MPSKTKIEKAIASQLTDKSTDEIEFAQQAERLAVKTVKQEDESTGSTQAVQAKFITPQDAIVETANGGRLPAVPIQEARKLNDLRDKLEDRDPAETSWKPIGSRIREAKDGTVHGMLSPGSAQTSDRPGAELRHAVPPSRTNPLFPPLPLYGPPTFARNLQCLIFRVSSAFLSFAFLMTIAFMAFIKTIPTIMHHIGARMKFQDPHADRVFFKEEKRRAAARDKAEKDWEKRKRAQKNSGFDEEEQASSPPTPHVVESEEKFVPTAGGKDPLVCDIRYYAHRVGLDAELFSVQTEDSFVIDLWHIYNPLTYSRTSSSHRQANGPTAFDHAHLSPGSQSHSQKKKYPVLMIHGLLHSAGAFCCNEEDSFAFYLAKAGYDVWLGNNRCGFDPRHELLGYSDPRMWAWNVRQMGVMDLPALVSRVLSETGFPKLALVAHSQGTTQTFVALAKEQRPDLGEKISVFCALAPAAYAGPLIGKFYFKAMRLVSPSVFRFIFGIHAFIPFMMTMHSLLPGPFYGKMGYHVFHFLFDWSDARWEKRLRNRMFLFAPTYVSAESMRWWLGRECFARQKCILATKAEVRLEDAEDAEEDETNGEGKATTPGDGVSSKRTSKASKASKRTSKASSAMVEEEDTWHAEEDDWETREEDKENDEYFNKHHSHPTEGSVSQEKLAVEEAERKYGESEKKPEGTEQVGTSTATQAQTTVEGNADPSPSKDSSEDDRGRFAWYNASCPPFALWCAGSDDLVDGRRLLRRFNRGREPYVDIVHSKVIPEYEHLDVIWAMDAMEKVGREVKEVIWATAGEEARGVCRVPVGCENVGLWKGRTRGR